MTHEYRHLKPHKSVFDMEKPFNISDNVVMSKPAIAMQANWMHMKEEPTERDLQIRERMYSLPDA